MTPELPQSADQMQDILDITGVRGDPVLGYLRLGIALIILLLILTILFFALRALYRWWQAKRDESRLEPHKRALLELERLEKQKFLDRGEWQSFYFFLTEIFKNYLQERLHIDALDKTDADLRAEAKVLVQLAGEIKADPRDLITLLERAELAKFARLPASVVAGRQDLDWLRQFVIDSHRVASAPSSDIPGGKK